MENAERRVNIAIIYNCVMDREGINEVVGGIETYIKNLSEIFSERKFHTVLLQFAAKEFRIKLNNLDIVGVKTEKIHDLVKEAEKRFDIINDILLFASDDYVVKSSFKRTITIQHGISWDGIREEKKPTFSNYVAAFKNYLRAIRRINRFRKCSMIVCVDYNFPNWYKTQVDYLSGEMYVIPNFTHIPSAFIEREDQQEIRIVFARRYTKFRGTRLFSRAIDVLLKEFDNIRITFAGRGPDEGYLREHFMNEERVSFTKYNSNNSIDFHSQYDIAVVPSLFSEGTSLSLLEAMSAGCAVVTTCVGGITNIVINGYNGIMVMPEEDKFIDALRKCIADKELRRKIAFNGYCTVKEAFSYDRWKNEWYNVVDKVLCEE